MAKKQDLALLKSKMDELHAAYNAMKTAEGNANTRGTKMYKIKREERTLALINHLVAALPAEYKWEDADRDTLVLLTTLASERTVYSPIEVKEGDVIIDLLQKYDGRRDLLKKMTEACEKAGLKMNFQSGKIEAKA